MSDFEIRAKDGMARIGLLPTKHGRLRTPLLMPVVHPGKSAVSPKALIETYGFQMIITNSYIIKSHEKFRSKAQSEGVHSLLDVDVPVMTDSGTFQMYFHGLPEDEIDPLEIVRFQKEIGSDIGTILDVFSDPKVGKSKVEEDVRVSIERARISVGSKDDMLLAGTVQGGIYPDLRRESARKMAELDFDIHPVGGAVPLMEAYRYADVVRATLAAKEFLPVERPVHLFGCGHPMFFALATLLGCDLFDSASYAKFAETGRLLLTTGTVHLQDLTELPCNCPVCSRTTAEEMKNLKKNEQELALLKHNLYISAAEMRRVRQAIYDGRLLELASIRARGHPSLYDALQVFLSHYNQIEEYHPVGNSSSVFYTGPETADHPDFVRFTQRILDRYPYTKSSNLFLVPHHGDRPFAETTSKIVQLVRSSKAESSLLVFAAPLGVVPWELEHVFPAQHCIFPRKLDIATINASKERTVSFIKTLSYNDAYWVTRDTPTDSLLDDVLDEFGIARLGDAAEGLAIMEEANTGEHWPQRKLGALMAYQWGLEVGSLSDIKGLSVKVSKSTGKIRHVTKGEDILFTIIPTTGMLAPTMSGGLYLLEKNLGRDYQVTLENEAAEFVAKGKSALAKFVIEASPLLRAGEEVIVVNEDREPVGVGRASLNGNEMISFNRGVAVNTRHSRL
ncbi:MAG: tRNA guanosine(15) transglycosylase TgtA [Candidatus Thorarchaeota archaeon]|nr:MAG: tRNA guanosine(15) transglycosylase TgtA [Candidatus Thorarchaeota archaeon]